MNRHSKPMSRSLKTDIEDTLSKLWDRETEFGTAVEAAAEAEHNYKMKDAEEFLKAEGTIDAKKATALKACGELHLNYLKKKAIKEFTRIKLQDAQDALSAQQSLLRAEMGSDALYSTDRRTT